MPAHWAPHSASCSQSDTGKEATGTGTGCRSYSVGTTPGQIVANRVDVTRSLLSLEVIDGFDPADLPENPLAVLFHRLDPALVHSTRINPVLAGAALLDSLARRMAFEESLALPPDAQAQAGKLGFQIANLADPEPEPEAEMPSP